MKRLALLGSLVLALTGCYETPRPNCAFACGPAPDFACPDGYACQDDNICHLMRSDNRIAECDPEIDASSGIDSSLPILDAADVDAPPVDASPADASPADAAPIDARPPDANVDATVDATVDADLPDADLPDADLPDA